MNATSFWKATSMKSVYCSELAENLEVDEVFAHSHWLNTNSPLGSVFDDMVK
jgi:hypothetical protein